MSKLKIGTKLYRVSGNGIDAGIFSYSVKEIREQSDNVQYVIECENCDHHEPCLILITPDDREGTMFRFVRMLNNNGYVDNGDGTVEYDFHHDHRCYHDTADGSLFTVTRLGTAKLFAERQIRFLKDRIEKRLREIEEDKKRIKKIEFMLETLAEKDGK